MTAAESLRMGTLELSLLGAPKITRDGEPVAVDTRKAVALLAYLAVTGRPHTRDALCNLLWPEYDHEHARGALRRTLSTLRKALAGDWIETNRETVALRRGEGLRIDVDDFRARLRSERPGLLEESVGLYGGDFLAGFTLRDSVAFDDWQAYETESLRRELAEALDRVAALHADRGELDAAVAHARRRLALNTLDEPAHRRLIELYARKGERLAAVRQYRECVRILYSELGVGPVEETQSLYRAIQEGAPPPAKPAVTVEAPPAGEHATPLVGREREWDALLQAHRKIERDGRLAVIEGEMGIGKSRLADDFLASLSRVGAVAITARCHEDERTLAYAPVAEAVRAALDVLDEIPRGAAEELGRLLPDASPPPSHPLDSKGAQTRFFESLRAALEAAVIGSTPGVLFFDDVHYADDASLEFLGYLARRLQSRPMLVLFTWRSDEVGATHRMRRLLTESTRGGFATVIRPRRLSERDIEALASSATGADADVQTIHRETDGLPLFVVEYLRSLAAGDADPVEGGIRELIRAQLAPLSDLAAQLLAAGAVAGSNFDGGTAREAGGRTEEETVAALEELTSRGLIIETGDQYEFRHQQVREIAYDETSLARRRLLHGRVGDALARRRDATGALAAQIARHYQLAARDDEAAAYFVRAGEHARSLYANRDALAYFEAALALGHPDPAAVHEAVADLQTLLGDYGSALAAYDAAAAHASPESAAALEHKLGSLHLRRGAWELASSHLAEALDSAGDDVALRARILADLSLVQQRRGDGGKALETAREAVATAETVDDDAALAQAHNIIGILLKEAGDRDGAREHLDSSLRWADEHGHLGGRIAAINNLALLDRAAGDVDGAIERTRQALELCERFGDRHREAALHNNLADLLHERGDDDQAMAHLKEAVTIFAEVGEEGEPQPEIWKLVEW